MFPRGVCMRENIGGAAREDLRLDCRRISWEETMAPTTGKVEETSRRGSPSLLEERTQLARVLLIDDDPLVLGMLEKLFTRAGYEVAAAADGEDALRLQKENPADVVICDILMPKKEGFETITELRESYPDIKIVAISGGGRNEPQGYLKFAMSFGADRALTKPMDVNALLDIVRELLEGPSPAEDEAT